MKIEIVARAAGLIGFNIVMIGKMISISYGAAQRSIEANNISDITFLIGMPMTVVGLVMMMWATKAPRN